MTNDSFRKDCKRLFKCETIHDCIDMIDIYVGFFTKVISIDEDVESLTVADLEAKQLFNMMLSKSLHLRKILEGITFNSYMSIKASNVIDPTIVAILIRNIYETVAVFNLIYRQPKSKEEKNIIYKLWVLSGLKYRQRFEDNATTSENREKLENERVQISNIESTIKNSTLFEELDNEGQKCILNRIKKKDYKIIFENEKVRSLQWYELADVMGMKKGLMDNIYNFFSLYTHPSNVSVFQYADLLSVEEQESPKVVLFNLKTANLLFSVFIADYIHLFPDVLNVFEELTLMDQVAINFHNTTARSYDYSINDSYKRI